MGNAWIEARFAIEGTIVSTGLTSLRCVPARNTWNLQVRNECATASAIALTKATSRRICVPAEIRVSNVKRKNSLLFFIVFMREIRLKDSFLSLIERTETTFAYRKISFATGRTIVRVAKMKQYAECWNRSRTTGAFDFYFQFYLLISFSFTSICY